MSAKKLYRGGKAFTEASRVDVTEDEAEGT